jgi:hypothetical protein
MEGFIVSEAEIRAKTNPPTGFTEDFIRSVLEKSGIDFGRTAFVRGEPPNREWTNTRQLFMPTDDQMAAMKAEQEAREAQEKAEKLRGIAESNAKDAELVELRAKLALLSGGAAVEEVGTIADALKNDFGPAPPGVEVLPPEISPETAPEQPVGAPLDVTGWDKRSRAYKDAVASGRELIGA